MEPRRSSVMVGCALSGCLLWLLGGPWAMAAEADAKPEPKKAEKAADEETPPPVVYTPPKRGKPRGRVGGGVRSPNPSLPAILALVPEHTGHTVSARPPLFWFIAATPPPGVRIFFTLVDEQRLDPRIEVELARPSGPGIQRIELAEHDVDLEPGTEYEWAVALVIDPEQRAWDRVTTGWIDRVELPPAVAAGANSAVAYARQGIWYDALAAAMDDLRAAPDQPGPRAVRDGLLRQAGLGEALVAGP
jgi:hypothetical protein